MAIKFFYHWPIDLDEYIEKVQHSLNDKENRRDDMMAKENKMISN